jgi:hypothetical protein
LAGVRPACRSRCGLEDFQDARLGPGGGVFLQALQVAHGPAEGALEAGALYRKPVKQSHLPFSLNVLPEDAALADLEAGQLPLRHGHLFDEELLGAVVGLPVGFEIGAERVEFLNVFAGEQEAASPQALAENVELFFENHVIIRGAKTRFLVPISG